MNAIPAWIWLLALIGALTSLAAVLILALAALHWHDIKTLWRNW